MFKTAIILPQENNNQPFEAIRGIEGVGQCKSFSSDGTTNGALDNALLATAPELIPQVFDLLIIADQQFCNYNFLSLAIRQGCHLFLSGVNNLTTAERKLLVQLAQEGGTLIQIQNDFLSHPLLEKISVDRHQSSFLEIAQSVASRQESLEELLSNNLQLMLRATGSPVHRMDIFYGILPSKEPDMLNLHLNFANGSVGTITVRFIDQQESHTLSIHHEGKILTYDFANSWIGGLPDQPMDAPKFASNHPLLKQIRAFVQSINKKNHPSYSLDDEIRGHLLLQKVAEKMALAV